MAHSNTWRTTIPSELVRQNQLDDHIRRLRDDIQDRMNDLGIDWTADPITQTLTRYQYLHWSHFKYHLDGDDPMGSAGNLNVTTGGLATSTVDNLKISGAITLPRGSIIQDLHLSCTTGANGTIPWNLTMIDATSGTPTETVITSGTVAANTAQSNVALATSLAHTIDSTASNYKYYYVHLNLIQAGGAGGVTVQGLRIKYTITNPFNRV